MSSSWCGSSTSSCLIPPADRTGAGAVCPSQDIKWSYPWGNRSASELDDLYAAWGRRAHRLEPDPVTAPVVPWMLVQRLAGHSTAWINGP
jgi:hypothetical protein